MNIQTDSEDPIFNNVKHLIPQFSGTHLNQDEDGGVQYKDAQA